MSCNLNILCLLVTDTCQVLGDVFCTRAPSNSHVAYLLSEVKNVKRLDIPDNLPADRFTAWMPCSLFPTTSPQDFTDYVNKLQLNSDATCTATRLGKGASLEECFPDPLPPGRVHLVVQLPQVAGLKRKQGERVRIAPFRTFCELSPYSTIPPSGAARPRAFRVYQRDDTIRLLDDRPNKDSRITPIALLYRPFGQFLDHIRDPPETVEDLDPVIEYVVDRFAYLMRKHYKNKLERREEIIEALNGIFGCYKPQQIDLSTITSIIKDEGADGHAIGPGQTPDIIVQIINEHGADDSDPEIHLSSYYTQIHSENLKSGHYDDLYESSLLPALGVSIIGSYIGFSALVILDRPRFVALTPMLPTRFPSGDNSARPALLQAFCAACVLRSNIRKDASLILNHPSPPLEDRNLPYVQKIAAWQPTSDRNPELEFKILAVAVQDQRTLYWNKDRFLYAAKTQDGPVLVKFTHQYFPELHSFCAERGHALKLLGYGTVPGEWKVVVMEYIEGGPDKLSEHASKHWAKWNNDLTMLMKRFHDKGWVHGDLQETNFISPPKEPEKIMLVDFDWGGESGKASYPTCTLNEYFFDRMTTKSLRITKENDVRVLTGALERLQRLGVRPPNEQLMDMS